MADGLEDDHVVDRVAKLETGQTELRESMHKVSNSLQIMQFSTEGLAKKFDQFVERQNKAADTAAEEKKRENRSRALTPERIVVIIAGSLGAAGSMFAALIWFIHSFTTPIEAKAQADAVSLRADMRSGVDAVQGAVTALASQTADRFNGQTTQLNNRFDTFQDSIRDIRNGAQKTYDEIAASRVAIGRMEDRMTIVEKRWDAWDHSDWPGINATQSAEIVANRSRIDRIEQKQEDRIRRELDNLTHERDRERDRQDRAH